MGEGSQKQDEVGNGWGPRSGISRATRAKENHSQEDNPRPEAKRYSSMTGEKQAGRKIQARKSSSTKGGLSRAVDQTQKKKKKKKKKTIFLNSKHRHAAGKESNAGSIKDGEWQPVRSGGLERHDKYMRGVGANSVRGSTCSD